MQGKVQIEAAQRAQRERILRLNRYSQGRKDQDTIKRLSHSMKGKGTAIAANTSRKSSNLDDLDISGVKHTRVPESVYDFGSLDPSMFR